MRPIKLVMSALGPYADTQTIDFRDATDAGLFGIYGPTGQPIRPKTAKVLAWPTRGITSVRASSIPGRGPVVSRSQTATGMAFARSVKGVPPNPFLLKALPAALTP